MTNNQNFYQKERFLKLEKRRRLRDQIKYFDKQIENLFCSVVPFYRNFGFFIKDKKHLTTFYKKPNSKNNILFSTNSFENKKELDNFESYDIDFSYYKICINDTKFNFRVKSNIYANKYYKSLISGNYNLSHTVNEIDLLKEEIEPFLFYKMLYLEKPNFTIISNVERFKLDNPEYSCFQMDRVNLYLVEENKSYFIDFFFDVVEMLKFKQNLEIKKKVKNEKQ